MLQSLSFPYKTCFSHSYSRILCINISAYKHISIRKTRIQRHLEYFVVGLNMNIVVWLNMNIVVWLNMNIVVWLNMNIAVWLRLWKAQT